MNEPNQDVPMIHTSKGNLPIASLEERFVRQDFPGEIVYNIEHWLGDECVRRQCNTLMLTGLECGASFTPVG